MAKVKLKDIPAGHDGNAYVAIGGMVYPAFKVSKLTPRTETIQDNKRFLGERVEQTAVRGIKHVFDMDYYMMSSALLQAMRDYEDGADYPDISIQYHSTAPGRGRQEVLLTGVILSNVGMGALDDGSDTAQVHSTQGAFEDWQLIEKFKEM